MKARGEMIPENKRVLLAISILLPIFFAGCEIPLGNDEQPQTAELSYLNVGDAAVVFVGYYGNATDASILENLQGRIYKVTEDDQQVEPVGYYSEDDDTLYTRNEPVALYDTGGDYFVLGLGYLTGGSFDVRSGYLIRKSDGQALSLSTSSRYIFPRNQSYFLNTGTIQTDDAGNLYFADHFTNGNSIYKVSVSGGSVSAEEVVNESGIDWFMVNGSGSIAYANKDNVLSTLQTTSGNEIDLESVNFWVAADQQIYVDQYNYDAKMHDIVRITPVSQDTVAFDTVAADLPDGLTLSNELNYLLNAGGRTLITIPVDSAEIEIWEVYNQDNPPQLLQNVTLDFAYIKSAAASNSALYFAGIGTDGQPRLDRVDVLSHTPTTVTDQYDITELEVTPNGDVFFGGHDSAGEKKVIGVITPGGDIEILDNTLAVPAFNLISID